jgi:sialic acid synthase SpsE
MEPNEFKAMVDAVREAEQAIGGVRYGAGLEEAKNKVFRRSLFASRPIKAGEVFSADNVRVIRPGYGLPPDAFDFVMGRRATVDIDAATPLSWAQVGREDG